MSPLARPELFWPTERAAAALGRPDVRVVDCRAALGSDSGPVDAHETYLAGHLPGAVHCQWTYDLSAPPPPSGHPLFMLVGPADFASTMARLGIGTNTFVLAYDSEGGHHAARLWVALRRYGHDRFAVIEGGLEKWRAEQRPLDAGEVTVPPAAFTPRPTPGVLASRAEVLAAVRQGDPWLLDVRRPAEYTGEEQRATRGGHVPGAVNILWRDALRDDWTLKDPDELERLYADAGFSADTATVTYCQAGVRAAFTHLVLTALGHDDVRTYDGSWEEWGNDPAVPVVRGRS